MPTYTPSLGIRQRSVGELFPPRFSNTWGYQINEELGVIDAAVGAVCTPAQIAEIKAELARYRENKARCGVSEGMIL